MSTLTAAFNLDEPPPKINQPPSPTSSSMFSSLPNDIVLAILSRVPKRCYPILSCVSKTFKILVRSREIHKLRSDLGKDSLYICFNEYKYYGTRNWFTLHRSPEKNPTDENLFISINVPFLHNKTDYTTVIAVGPEIFFFEKRSYGNFPLSLWIFDSRSKKYRRGPSKQVEALYSFIITVALVGCKIYVIGWEGKHGIRADFLDLKTQTWKQASIPKSKRPCITMVENFVIDRKVCWLTTGFEVFCYNTRDNSLESFRLFANQKWSNGLCVVDNVLYVYFRKLGLGLMWYDFKLREWRMVNGLDDFKNIAPIGMAEYYGKLAYMWQKADGVVGSENKQIWCRMIALDRNEAGMHGTAEPCQLLGIVPRTYTVRHFLSLSD